MAHKICSYRIDLEKIVEFIKKDEVKNNNTSVTQVWAPGSEMDDSLQMITKEISENKTNYSETLYDVRYNLILTLLTPLLSGNTPMDSTIEIDLNTLTFQQRLCMQTLLKEKILLYNC